MEPKKRKRARKSTGKKYNTRTRDEVVELLDNLLKDLTRDDEIYTESVLRAKYKIARKTYTNWKTLTYHDDGEIIEKLDLIETICESRIEDGGLKNKINPYFAKFLLVSKHNYVETTKTEVNAKVEHSGGTNINVTIEGSRESVNL